MSLVGFYKGTETNIKNLKSSSSVKEGAIYVATDTGTMWLGTSTTALLQIKDNIDTNTTYTALKNPNAITISLNGTSQGAYDGSAAKSINITASSVGAAASSHKHAAADITSVNASAITGTIAAANLPSYVDDVLEYNGTANFPTTGESGKIYTDTSTNKIYRWSGSQYVVISDSLALGTTSSTAFRGDYGNSAYAHISRTDNPHGVTKAQLGLGSVENKSSATIRGELTKANVTTALGYTPPTTDTNTHYTSKNVVGASTATSNTTSALTNGNVYLNSVENGAVTSAHKISGSGATTVTSDASGNIVVSSTNTTYSSLKNPNALTISLNGTSQGAYDGSAAKSINITASSVGAAASSHTHSYAGSSSAGGAATSAAKLNTNAGSATGPVYFSNGIPVACTTYADASVKYATSAGSASNEYAVISGTSQPTDSRCKVWLVTNSSGTLTGVQVKV